MPSQWMVREGSVLSDEFNSPKNQAVDIAALKIYVGLCLFSHVVKKSIKSEGGVVHIEQMETMLTYDQMSDRFSLSRSSINQGIKKLRALSLIGVSGTIRKKVYVIYGSVSSGWCKLPKKNLIDRDYKVRAFQEFNQRLSHERNALKIFIYLLAIRGNLKSTIKVSRGKISSSTGVNVEDINGAIKFLSSIELIDDVRFIDYLTSAGYGGDYTLEGAALHEYSITGGESLVRKPVLEELKEKPKPKSKSKHNLPDDEDGLPF